MGQESFDQLFGWNGQQAPAEPQAAAATQTLDAQTLDAQALDAQALDAQTLPVAAPGAEPLTRADGGGRNRDRKSPERKRRRRKRLLIALSIFVVLILALLTAGYFTFTNLQAKYDKQIHRIGDPFTGSTNRPSAGVAGSTNILLLGSDSRTSGGDPLNWKPGAQRTDTIMILHLNANQTGAYVISIPRDSWVNIPGHGMAKINAGFSYGGPKLMVQTIEQFTGVRIDHVALIDFDGFKQLTDALGGVTITIPKATHDNRASWTVGTYNLNGEQALNYVRQRHDLAQGDFDRERRQQNWIRAIAHKMLAKSTLFTDPAQLNDAIDVLTKNIATDNSFKIDEMTKIGLAFEFFGETKVRFFLAPVGNAGARSADGQDIVLLDSAKNAALWKAVREDKVADFVKTYHPNMLGKTVS